MLSKIGADARSDRYAILQSRPLSDHDALRCD
jgi:hypothetical protein